MRRARRHTTRKRPLEKQAMHRWVEGRKPDQPRRMKSKSYCNAGRRQTSIVPPTKTQNNMGEWTLGAKSRCTADRKPKVTATAVNEDSRQCATDRKPKRLHRRPEATESTPLTGSRKPKQPLRHKTESQCWANQKPKPLHHRAKANNRNAVSAASS